MSWKSVKLFRFTSLSLVTKLMFFYSVSTIGLLSAIAIFLYPTFLKIKDKINIHGASYITAECYEKIIISLLMGSLFSIFLGYLVAKRGLNRMRDFELKIEQITADSLHEKIDVNEWPKELKRLGLKFNTMLARIQSSFNQLSQFSSDIAHELRTPLTNLTGMTELALSKPSCCDQYRTMLEKYMDEYQHLSNLIESLLFLARSDHGQYIMNKKVINVREEILKICDYYQALADEEKITLTCLGEANLTVDLLLFKRTINNLISNAIRYSYPHGKIVINIQHTDEWLEIAIADTGKGIPDKDLTRIFDRFYRVDSSRSSHSGGIGLGLAIVKSITHLHKGKITIKSQLNVGTTVSLFLPKLV